jgi:hypothetical protein
MRVNADFTYDVLKEHGYGTAETTEHAAGGPFFDTIGNPFGILPESK